MQRTVLIIDDEKDQCFIIATYLERQGFKVDCAYTLEDGIEKLRLALPDHLLLDNHLPDGPGWQYASLIHGLFPALKITLITGSDYRRDARDKGPVFAHMVKPLVLVDLLAYLTAA